VLDVVETLYRHGNLRLALECAERFNAVQAGLDAVNEFGALAALRLGDVVKALDLTKGLADAKRPNAIAIRGYCLARAGFGSGETLLREASQSADDDVRVQAAFRLALLYWHRGEESAAEAVINERLTGPAAEERSKRAFVLGWIEVRRRRYSVAALHLREAFVALAEAHVVDAWMTWHILQSLTILAFETIDFAAVRGLVIEEGSVGAEAMKPAFYATQNRAWLAMLSGKESDALELLQRSRGFANVPAAVASAEVDLSSYCRIRGWRDAAVGHLELAQRHLRLQKWSDANADERMALIDYATAAYELDPSSAGHAFIQYFSRELHTIVGLAFEGDPRVEALECMTRGIVEAAHGRKPSAERYLRNAVEAWRSLGYRVKEGTTSLMLHDLTGSAADLDVARRVARAAPRSWLATDVQKKLNQPA
jgi:hypothetical protein